MHPHLLGIRAYPLFLAIAALVAGWLFLDLSRRDGISWRRATASMVVLLLFGLAGGKLYSILETGSPSGGLRLDGIRHPGVMIGMIVIAPVALRMLGSSVTWPQFADLVVPGIAWGSVFLRIGCFLTGCCFGERSDLPWAVSFPYRSRAWLEHVRVGVISGTAPSSLAVHPLQIYFLIWSLVTGIVLLALHDRKAFRGQLVLVYLVMHEGGKALLETLRGHEPGRGAYLQEVSACLALVGAALYTRRAYADWRRARAVATAQT